MNFWDQRYSEDGFAYGTHANDFLLAEAHRIPAGRVLCLAEGEGRNAVYLATLGYSVTAVDQSAVGLAKAQRLAQQHNVSISTVVADLSTYDISPASWDGIVSISAHLPELARRRLHTQIVNGLKANGMLLLEAYTEQQLLSSGTGGPKQEHKDMFMSCKKLQQELAGLHFILLHEIERDVNEGRYHQGRGAVVQLIAAKNQGTSE